MALRPWRLTAATAALAGLATLAVGALPFLSFAYRSPELHVAFATAAALVALLAADLVFGRFRERRRLDELVLVCGLAVTAAINVVLAIVAAVLPRLESQAFITWSGLTGRLLGATLICLAAFVPPRIVRRPVRATVAGLAGCAVALALPVALLATLSARLPSGIDPTLSPEDSSAPLLVAHPVVHALQLVAMLLFSAAAVGFTRRAAATHDELLRWIAAASVLAAFARLNYFLFPSLYSEWVYTGDAFRLASYLVLLVGATRDIASYQRRTAVLEERRRIARDLHDGLAQELAFIVATARRLARGGPQETGRLAAAAERALAESRRAIAALSERDEEPLAAALAQTIEEVAGRAGARVALDLEDGVDVPPRMREELVRIAREAVTNAVRHGRATRVSAELTFADGLRLAIADNGVGFDPRHRGAGFGLTTMEERAHALGGELRISRRPEGGTAVEVLLPQR